jgi:hypothetical protein
MWPPGRVGIGQDVTEAGHHRAVPGVLIDAHFFYDTEIEFEKEPAISAGRSGRSWRVGCPLMRASELPH